MRQGLKKITLPFILIRWSRNGSRLSLGGVWPSVSQKATPFQVWIKLVPVET